MHRPGRGAASPGAGADPALERQLEPGGFRAETDYRIDVEQISSTNDLLALTADLMETGLAGGYEPGAGNAPANTRGGKARRETRDKMTAA